MGLRFTRNCVAWKRGAELEPSRNLLCFACVAVTALFALAPGARAQGEGIPNQTQTGDDGRRDDG